MVNQSQGTRGRVAAVDQDGWSRRAWDRMQWHWLLKMLGIPGYMGLFMLGYFWLLRHPMFPVTIMPLTALDHLIGFQPWSIVIYASLWLYISLVPMLIASRRELATYLSAVTVLSLAGFLCFFLWPTAVPAFGIQWARYPLVAFLKSVDASGNACPSLHVAFAVLTGVWLHRLLREVSAPHILRLSNGCWCLAILYSTLALKQHVALDVLAGASLGLVVVWGHLLWLAQWKRRRKALCPYIPLTQMPD